MNISERMADFAAGLTYESLPPEIRQGVDRRITDLIASAVAGYRVNKAMNDVVFRVLSQQDALEQSSLLFRRRRLSASRAAFYNAFVANGADMDDGHMLANGHPGVTVIPPVLALAEWRKIAYKQVAAAVVAGYEIYIRMSRAIMPSHLQRGFNGTGTVGSVAAACASARALGLPAERIHVAMGLAATSASGLMELNESGQGMKPINPANAAYCGVMCALLSEAGAVGPDAPLDGGKGFFKAFADSVTPDEITSGLGTDYQMDTAYIKLYPACRHMHAMIDCAAAIRAGGDISLGDIESATLYTYPMSEKLTGGIRHPGSSSEAKFSLTYSTAVALATGGYTLDDLTDEAEKGREVVSLIDRMHIVTDPALEDRKAMLRGGKLEVVLKNGEKRTSSVEVPKGEKRFPISDDDLFRKLAACSESVFDSKRQKQIFESGMHLEALPGLRGFFEMLISEE